MVRIETYEDADFIYNDTDSLYDGDLVESNIRQEK